MGRNTDKTKWAELLNRPCECIGTRGTQEGIILKFSTFYLKIYDDKCENSYIVKGYRYNTTNPMFTDSVKESDMREYATRVLNHQR